MAEFEHDIYSDPGDPETQQAQQGDGSDTHATIRGEGDDPIEPEIDSRGQAAPRARCEPCKARGQHSKCDRAWPSCSRCQREGTTDGCYQATHLAGRASVGPRAVSLNPPPIPPPSPARRDRLPPPALPIRRAVSAAPILVQQPMGAILVPDSSPPAPDVAPPPRAPICAPRRSQSPPRPPPSVRSNSRVRSPPPQRPPAGTESVTQALNAEATHLRQILQATEARLRELEAVAPPPSNGHLPPNARMGGVINAGEGLGTRQPMRIIPGYVGGKTFAIIPDAVRKQFTGPQGWVNYVSLRYFTDEYCEATSSHTALSDSLTYNADTNRFEKAPTELPGLNERGMTPAQWIRGWQRKIGFLKAIGHVDAHNWEMHYQLITSERDFFDKFAKWLSYCMAVRRRALQEPIDPATLQTDILEPIATEFERAETLASVRQMISCQTSGSGRHLEAPRPPPAHSSHKTQPALPARLARSASTPSFRKSGPPNPNLPASDGGRRCFLCGSGVHASTDCDATKLVTGQPMLAKKSTNGIWQIEGTTSAPYVAPPTTALKSARLDPRKVVTPLRADKWEDAIRAAGIWNAFSDVPSGLRAGFRLGTSSIISTTTVHKNHLSATKNPDVINNHIESELRAGRYSGPFSLQELQSLIGDFRASPLGVVDKPSAPGTFRVIQDFSYPVNPHSEITSVNSEIDSEQFGCEWGFFSDVVDILIWLPHGSQAATFDVDAAYRRMPVHPVDQPHIVVHWEGSFYLDHCVPFGATSSNGIFGRCGDCILRIFLSHNITPVVKWVDDFCFFRIPSFSATGEALFTVDEAQIYAIAAELGWPWKEAKTRPFANIFTYLGFEWNISERTVSIPTAKRTKFLAKIKQWISTPKATLRHTESLVGSLIHCALAVPEGRSRITGLTRFAAGFSRDPSRRFTARSQTARATEDAVWWHSKLSHPSCGSALRPTPPLLDRQFYMDASTSFGIGVVSGYEYGMWKLQEHWAQEGRDIGWAEIVAIEIALDLMISHGTSNASIQFWSDNQGVIGAIRAGRSRNDQQNTVLRRIVEKQLLHNIVLKIDYINTLDNIADGPSRGSPAMNSLPFKGPVRLDSALEPFVTPVARHSPSPCTFGIL